MKRLTMFAALATIVQPVTATGQSLNAGSTGPRDRTSRRAEPCPESSSCPSVARAALNGSVRK